MIIQVRGTDPTAVICQVAIVLFIRHLFNKEIKMKVARAKTIYTLRHAMTLDQKAEFKFKKYEGLMDDDPSVM